MQQLHKILQVGVFCFHCTILETENDSKIGQKSRISFSVKDWAPIAETMSVLSLIPSLQYWWWNCVDGGRIQLNCSVLLVFIKKGLWLAARMMWRIYWMWTADGSWLPAWKATWCDLWSEYFLVLKTIFASYHKGIKVIFTVITTSLHHQVHPLLVV